MKRDLFRTLPGPENTLKREFPNGVTVLIQENPGSSTAAICGSLFAGSCLEDPDKYGLSAFVSAALTGGTRSRSFTQITEYLEGMGASLSFSSAPHRIRFEGDCLSEDLTGLLELLKEILAEPAFPEDHVEYVRQQALEGSGLHPEDNGSFGEKMIRNILYREDHPYGRLETDMEESIRAVTRDDLAGFHGRFFGPKKLILALAGGFRAREVMGCCERIFGSWEKDQETPDENTLFPQIERIGAPIRMHIDMPEKTELSMVMGTLAPAANDPDALSFVLGNGIFGQFGMMGRLGRAVRFERGLAYNVYSSVSMEKNGGWWWAEAGVDPADYREAGEVIRSELRRFTSEPVTLKELEDARARFIGNELLVFRNNKGKAAELHRLAVYGRDLNYYQRLPEMAAAVTPETILETAQRWMDSGETAFVTIGLGGDQIRSWFPGV